MSKRIPFTNLRISERQSRRRLEELLELTRQGATFVITRNGTPIARLLPDDTDPKLLKQTTLT